MSFTVTCPNCGKTDCIKYQKQETKSFLVYVNPSPNDAEKPTISMSESIREDYMRTGRTYCTECGWDAVGLPSAKQIVRSN